jgi:hypothetical protein
MRTCEECTACCKLVGVSELDKPPGVWCDHCNIGSATGCQIYEVRPEGCRQFECLWLQTGNSNVTRALPDEMRPDRCKAVFIPPTDDTKIVSVFVDPATPDEWKKSRLLREYIDRIRHEFSVIIVFGKGGRRFLPGYTHEGEFLTKILMDLKQRHPDLVHIRK